MSDLGFSLDVADAPEPDLGEALTRARRLTSDRTGIIRDVDLIEIAADEPAVHWARSAPAEVSALTGQPAVNEGSAASSERDRAVIKAVGESVERYCSALFDESDLLLASFDELDDEAVAPEDFAMLSETRYREPDCRLDRFARETPVRWVQGRSLVTDRPLFVPAQIVYVPYQRAPGEARIWDPISTGLACGTTRAAATYKAICELAERDALMIVWQSRLRRPHIDLESVEEPISRMLLDALEPEPYRCYAVLLTLDVEIPVVLIVLASDDVPYTLLGCGADFDPGRALTLALEELFLSCCGMKRFADARRDYRPEMDYRDLVDLPLHGLAHAVDPRLRHAVDFLTRPSDVLSLDDLPNAASTSVLDNARTAVERLSAVGLDAIALELTTPDVDDAGFKVVRVVAPGMQPLDNDHLHQHNGGRRLYEVPWKLALVEQPPTEAALNPDPHPFP